MATPTIVSPPTTIDLAEAITNWGGDTFILEPDIKIQGDNSVSCALTTDGTNEVYVTGTWDFSGTGLGDQHLRLPFNIAFIGNLVVSNPIQVFLYDGTNTAYYYWAGSTSYTGGWTRAIIYTGDSPDSGTVNKAIITRIGMRFDTQTKPRNLVNSWFDAWYFGDGYTVTGGTSGDEITLAGIAAVDKINAYGIVNEINSVKFLTGSVQVGNGATTTWFKAEGDIVVFQEEQVGVGLYNIIGDGSGCRIDIDSSVFQAAGTAAKDKFDFDVSETNLLTCSVTNSFVVRADQVTFKSGQTGTGNVFDTCGQITHGGADMDDCKFKGYEGTADTSYMIYNVNADPNGELDDTAFTKGTALTHAIEFGTTSPLTMTLTGIAFSGYNAADAQTDSAIYVARTTDTVTINLSKCTGDIKYKSAGATVVMSATVPLVVTVVDVGGTAVVDAQTAIYKVSDDTELMNEDTIAGGIASQDFSYPGSDTAVYIRVRKSSVGTTRYKNAFAGGTIDENGLNVRITLTEEGVS